MPLKQREELMKKHAKTSFDYSDLKIFILSNKSLGSMKSFADYLGISQQALNKKLRSESQFSQSEIKKVATEFKLNSDQLVKLFFNDELQYR